MRRKEIRIAVSLALVCSLALGVCAANAVPMLGGRDMIKELTGEDSSKRTAAYAALLSSFRDSFASNPDAAAEYWLAPQPRSEWTTTIAGEMISQQLTDFFIGGILLAGGSSRKGMVAGVFNPWWDAILLVRLECRETSQGNKDDELFRAVTAASGMPGAPRAQVTEFHFLSGETFRGEVVDGAAPRVQTVVPEKTPLSVEVWRVAAGTRRRFEEMFPLGARPTWGGEGGALLRSLDAKREMERIQTRSALRLKLTLAFLKNAREVGIAAQIAELIRHGSHYRLFNHFRDPASRPLIKTLADMPEMFRKDFAPYGHVATAEATLYVFVNPKVPRLYATITLPRDRKKTPPSLEWYDLLQAEQLLAAWNGRKEVAK